MCVLVRARMAKRCHQGQAVSWANSWSAAWRAWQVPEAQPALASSKIRATATQRKRRKVRAKQVFLPYTIRLCLFLLPPPSSPLTSAPPLLPGNEGFPPNCFFAKAWWDISSSCSAVQSLQQEPLSPHWVCGGLCLFPVLTWVFVWSWAQARPWRIGHVIPDVLFLVWLAVYSGGLVEEILLSSSSSTPSQYAGPIITRFT